MKIYTKTGDKGETGLFGGDRVAKDTLRIEAYGTVDELNSLVGIIRALRLGIKRLIGYFEKIQSDLFILGADLAARKANKRQLIPRISRSHIASVEKAIDSFQLLLPPLKVFILPGGTAAASHLHYARTVCRRAERSAVRLSRTEEINESVLVYLNRLSDLFFVLARYANRTGKKKETEWRTHSAQR